MDEIFMRRAPSAFLSSLTLWSIYAIISYGNEYRAAFFARKREEVLERSASQHMQAAVFDLDGTLFNSLGVWDDADRAFLSRRNIELTPDYTEAVKLMHLEEAALYTKARYSLSESPKDIMDEWLAYIRAAYAAMPLKPYAREYLELLHAAGVKLAIATSSDRQIFLPALKHNRIDGLFSAAVTVCEVDRGKEYPDVYLEAARRIGAEPQTCAVFEDILPAVKAAKAGGFFTAAVFDEGSRRDEEALKTTADLFLTSYEELLLSPILF